MSNPFADEHHHTFVIVDDEGQHSLRYDRATADRAGMRPAGPVAGDAGRRAGE